MNSTTTTLPVLLKSEDVAEYLGVSTRTVEHWRLEAPDGPPYFRIGKHVRYRADLLEQWILQR